jgi:hypothetical protein
MLAIFGGVTVGLDVDAAWVVTAGAGMIGAVLSVLQRMTTGSLAVSAEADRRLVWEVGLFRPLVGSILGVVSYVLIGGGLVSLRPPDESSRPLFFAGIAFLAGFSERFARDMLVAPAGLLPSAKRNNAAKTPAPEGAAPQT